MKVYNPKAYVVEYSDKEIEQIEDALAILLETLSKMREISAGTLSGETESYCESFSYTEISNTATVLNRFCECVPNKMY